MGGCPYKRLFDERQCVAFKDDPDSYVLALHARIGEDKKEDEADEKADEKAKSHDKQAPVE